MGIQQAGARMSSAGRTLSRNVSLPVAAIGAVAVKTAIDFEKSMRNVNSIAQLPEPAFKRLSKSVEHLAGPTAQAPKTLADGLYDLVSSGFDAKESLVVLKSSAKAATAGLTTTEVSTKAVAAALNAYHRPAKAARQVSDDLFETVNRGVVSFDELAGSIGYVLPAASTMGINIKEVGAAISTLTKEGQSGETAVTNINQAVTAFIKPSKAMHAVLRELGYETSKQLVDQKGFQGALETVTKAVGGGEEAIGDLFGNVRAMRAVFGLTGKSARMAGTDLRAFGDDTGSTAKVFKEQSKSLAFQWQKLKAEAATLGIEMGGKLIPLLRQVGQSVAGMVKTFLGLPGGVQKGIVEVGLFAVALGPVIRVAGALTTGIGGLVKAAGALKAMKLGQALAEGFSIFRTGLASGQGLLGSFQIAGGKGASALVTGLKTGIPLAIAGAGIANIISSATDGDMKQAGFKAGGALVGGIAGAFLGGPLGAAVGVGAGSFLGGLVGNLFDSEKRLTPLQKSLRDMAAHAADAFKRQADAARGLGNAQDALSQANHRHQRSTQAVKRAHEELNSAIRKFGPASQQANEAELRLARAQHKDAETAKEAKDAHKLAGNELRLYQHRTVEAVASEKQRIPGLQRMVTHLQKQYGQEKNNYQLLERLVGKERELSGSKKHLNDLIEEAATKSGPKFARSLERMSDTQAAFGKHFRGLVNQMPSLGHATQTATQRAEQAFGHFTDVFHTQSGRAKGDVASFDHVTSRSMADVITRLNNTLSSLGVKEVAFAKKQRGGTIDLGAPSGDSVPAMLEKGEYVLNRNAVRAIGTSTLDSLNFSMAPRFQKGGPLGAEPQLGGTEPLHGAGQHAIHQVFKAATRYYNQHNGKARVIANGSRMDALHQPYLWGGGHGATASTSGPWDCSGGISELFDGAGWNFPPMVSGGFTNWGLPGKGDVSVLANSEHVYAVVDGKGAIGTSSENPGGGFGWINGYTFRPGFTIRHADFSEQAMARANTGRRGRGQKQKRGFQSGGLVVSGKASYEGGTGNATADGSHTDEDPGFAIRDDSTLGDWFWATVGGASGLLQHIDWGPASWTGRSIDFTEAGLRKIGAPLGITDTPAKVEWMGHTVADAVKSLGSKRGKGTAGQSVKDRREERRQAIKAAKIESGKAIWAPPLKPTALPPAARGLAPTVKKLLRAPGIGYGGKVGVSELALSQAEDTTTKADDEAVLNYQEMLFVARQKELKRKLTQVEEKLKVVRSPAEQKRLLGKATHLREELGSVQGSLSGVRSTRKGLNEESENPEAAAADLEMARAEATPGKEDDLKALQHLEDLAKKELERAEKSGDPKEIAEATRNLTAAAQALRDATPTAEDWANRELALAELTAGKADDLAALHQLLAIAEQELQEALATPDPRDDIEAAHKVKGLRDSLEGVEQSQSELQTTLQELNKTLKEQQEVERSSQSITAREALRALAEVVEGKLGPSVYRAGLATGIGKVGTA